MKLLFDQNLSHKLVYRLEDLYPDSIHVRDLGMNTADDIFIWDYAKTNDLMIVSKDADFHQRSFVYGFPPKVIWIKLGNCSTSDVEKVLRNNLNAIHSFYNDENAAFLSLIL